MFWGRQSRQGAKFLQRRKAISNTLDVEKESVPAMLEKLHALTPLCAEATSLDRTARQAINVP